MTKLLQQAIEQVEKAVSRLGEAGRPRGRRRASWDYLDQMRDGQLSDEQVAEVRRRPADPERKDRAARRGCWFLWGRVHSFVFDA